MTSTASTTGGDVREVTANDAIISVAGYLGRVSGQLTADHASGVITPASLRGLLDGIYVMAHRLDTAASALAFGGPDTPMFVTDTPGGLVRCLECGDVIGQRQVSEHAETHRYDDGTPMPVLFREPDRF